MNSQTDQIYLSLICLTVLFLSCKDNVLSDTESSQQLPTFSRNSDWRLDSLDSSVPFSYQSAIWGSGPSDIYVVGSGVVRFNGFNWNVVPMHTSVGGPVYGSFGFDDVFGFSSSDVWAAGTLWLNSVRTPLLVHYNGNAWSLFPTAGNYGISLQSIWGVSSGDVWAGGNFGLILHYDGQTWTQEDVSFHPNSGDSWYVTSFAGYKYPTPFALISLINSTSPVEVKYLIKRVGNKWNLIDSVSSTSVRCTKLYMSPSSTLYSAGRHLSRWTGTSWQIIRQGTDDKSIFQVVANSDDNLFILGGSVWGHSGFIEHFNGSNWVTVVSSLSNNIAISDGFTNGSSVAGLGWDSNFRYFVVRSF